MPTKVRNEASERTYVLLCAITYCFISLLFGFQMSIMGPMATVLAKQAGCTEADLAPVLGLGGLGMVLGGIPSGWMFDRAPGHAVLAISHIVQAVGFLIMPMCNSVLSLALVYGTISLTFNMVNTGVNCLGIWILTPGSNAAGPATLPFTAGFLLNAISMFFGVGALLAPQIVHVIQVATGTGTGVYYVAVAVASSVAVMLTTLLPAGPLPPGKVLKMLEAKSGSISVTEAGVVGVVTCPRDADLESTAPLLEFEPIIWDEGAEGMPAASGDCLPKQKGGGRWKLPFQGALLALIFSNVSIELGFGNWIYTYCVRHVGLSEAAGQQVTSLFWLAFTVGRLPAMLMASCVSVSAIMVLMMPMAAVGSLIPFLFSASSATTASGVEAPFGLVSMAGGSSLPPWTLMWQAGRGILSLNQDNGRGLAVILVTTVLVAAGAAPGVSCGLGMATEYVEVDGFLNGLVSTAAGLGATTFPFVVPVLAQAIPAMGFQCLMAATLVMAVLQMLSLFAMISFGRSMRKEQPSHISRRRSGPLPSLPSWRCLSQAASGVHPLLQSGDGDAS